MIWTEERIDQLKALYSDPHIEWSFSEIAAKLGGGLSRNAVIGKAHRLGLDRRRTGAKPRPEVRTLRARPQGIGAAVQKINMAKDAPPQINLEPFVMQCAEVEPLGIGLMDLTDKTCRWPVGEQPPFLFCGHPAQAPYCPAHSRIAFPPRIARRSAPHPAELGKARGGIFGRSA